LSKLTLEKRDEFLAELRDGQSISAAATSIHVSRQAIYKLKLTDTEFAEAMADAVETGTDSLEDEAVKRARAGSDTLLIFLLKGRRPDKYRENVRTEHTGKDGGPIRIVKAEDLTDDDLAAIAGK
jgi:hypothetical protein